MIWNTGSDDTVNKNLINLEMFAGKCKKQRKRKGRKERNSKKYIKQKQNIWSDEINEIHKSNIHPWWEKGGKSS
jgi:hypothetical protein